MNMRKQQKLIIGGMISILCIFVCGVLGGCKSEKTVSSATGGYVHFSVDDATQIFQEITLKQYNSIFEQPMLRQLLKFHDDYGLKCTLYLYENVGDYNISRMPDDYREEFEANSDWLKLAFHGYNEENPEESGLTLQEYEASFSRVCDEIRRFAGEESLSQTLRLHYWYATEDMMDFLKENGVKSILCPDTQITGYDLTHTENNMLNESKNGILERDILYYRTDLRYENMEKVEEALRECREDQVIVIFTHAWCFEENIGKIEDSLKWFEKNGYQFIYLENREGL